MAAVVNKRVHEEDEDDLGSGQSDSEEERLSIKRKQRDGNKENIKKPKRENKTKWSNEMLFNLIDEYEARPCLWDVFSDSYHNRDVTSKAKAEVQESLGIEWKLLSVQLTKLRQILSQNIKKQNTYKSGQGADDVYNPTWIFWKSLQFLIPVMNARQSRDTIIAVTIEDDESTGEDMSTSINIDEPESVDPDLDATPSSTVTPARKYKAKQKVQLHAKSDSKDELMKECLRLMKAPNTPPVPVTPNDAESSFGAFVAQKLKSFDRRTQIIGEKRITDVLFDLEMEMSDGPQWVSRPGQSLYPANTGYLQNPEVYLRSDEAGCYHNNHLIAAARDIGDRVGITVVRYDFSEPQQGKDICDRVLCPMKGAIRKYCAEGHDIINVSNMREALKERPIKGTTAAVSILNDSKKNLQINKITRFSELHNFRYENSGLRVWKAYAVGIGKLIPWQSLYVRHQGPTNLSMNEGQGFFESTQMRKLPIKKHQEENDENEEEAHLFLCPEAGCTDTFDSFSELELHIDVGVHEIPDAKVSFYDTIRKDWAEKISSVDILKQALTPEGGSSEGLASSSTVVTNVVTPSGHDPLDETQTCSVDQQDCTVEETTAQLRSVADQQDCKEESCHKCLKNTLTIRRLHKNNNYLRRRARQLKARSVNVDDTTESPGSEFEDDGNCEPSKKNIQEESTASELNDTELEDGDIDPDWMSIGEETEGSATADDEDIDNDKNESTVRVESGIPVHEEPKFLVFYTMLLNLFTMFCFHCKMGKPKGIKISMFCYAVYILNTTIKHEKISNWIHLFAAPVLKC
ncbi:hypothetical protein QZH41_006730 [Actinostola sp. cb2023]|nr:hypothetical protein QZH41_006730 [Actinostola sp. cb2023]